MPPARPPDAARSVYHNVASLADDRICKAPRLKPMIPGRRRPLHGLPLYPLRKQREGPEGCAAAAVKGMRRIRWEFGHPEGDVPSHTSLALGHHSWSSSVSWNYHAENQNLSSLLRVYTQVLGDGR